MDVSAKGCDAYLEKWEKDCNEFMVILHDIGAVNNELLLLHVTGIKCKSNLYRKDFLLQCTCLPAFQNTYVDHGYQRHTCALATICWEHQHLIVLHEAALFYRLWYMMAVVQLCKLGES